MASRRENQRRKNGLGMQIRPKAIFFLSPCFDKSMVLLKEATVKYQNGFMVLSIGRSKNRKNPHGRLPGVK